MLFTAKTILVVEQQWYYLTLGWGGGFISFSRVFIQKVNVIARLEFELAYFKVKVQHLGHYTKRSLVYFYLDDDDDGSCQKTEKAVEHEGDGDTNCRWYPWDGFQKPGKKVGWTKKKQNRDHPEHNTAKKLPL